MKINKNLQNQIILVLICTFSLFACQKEDISIEELNQENLSKEDSNHRLKGAGLMYDIDGNEYPTVVIGKQLWMAENLKTTRYRDGALVQEKLSSSAWSSATEGARCYFGNIASYIPKFGLLYNGYAVTSPHGLAPEGWRIPTIDDFIELETYLGGNGLAASKLKESGRTYWSYDYGTNSSGFSARGAGYRQPGGTYGAHHTDAYFYTSPINNNNLEYFRIGAYDNNYFGQIYKKGGLSVRCIKDLPIVVFQKPYYSSTSNIISFGSNFYLEDFAENEIIEAGYCYNYAPNYGAPTVNDYKNVISNGYINPINLNMNHPLGAPPLYIRAYVICKNDIVLYSRAYKVIHHPDGWTISYIQGS